MRFTSVWRTLRNEMAAVVQMRAALMRCGLNQATADYVMNEQGYDSLEELMLVKNAIRAAPPGVNFASVAIRRLNAFKHWSEECDMCGLELTPALFTAEVMNAYLRLLRADEIEVPAKKDQKTNLPDVLKQKRNGSNFGKS